MTKKLTARQKERKASKKAEKEAIKELSMLRKSDHDEYVRRLEIQRQEYLKNNTRNKEERQLQVKRLKKKLIQVGIQQYLSGFKRFEEISEKFIESGEDIEEDIHIEEMQGVYLIISLKIDKSKDCSITTKNLNVSSKVLDNMKELC